jgi:prepilin-type N-terminal cleavage/methylation domain-containing protein
MKKNGFTLIELLAVIVILAVIALIATPIIMNAINDARKGSVKDAAYGVAKAVEYSIALAANTDADYTLPTTVTSGTGVGIKGTAPDAYDLTLTNGAVTGGTLTFGDYTATFSSSGVVTVTP